MRVLKFYWELTLNHLFSVGIKLCAKHRNVEIARIQGGPPMVGAFLPSCKLNGDYEEVQCHGSTGFCWCVDKLGNEMLGTRTRGEPNCTFSGMIDRCLLPIYIFVIRQVGKFNTLHSG